MRDGEGMMRRVLVPTGILFLGFVCSPAFGDPLGLEITPFGAFQFGGEFEDEDTGEDFRLDETGAFGVMVDWDLNWQQQIEFYFDYQPTRLNARTSSIPGSRDFDVDISYYHVGGTYSWEEYDRIRPFVVGTFGLTHFDPDLSGSGSRTRFSMGLGGGAKFMATDNFGLRLEGRGLLTFVDSSTSIYCGEGCTVDFSGSGFWQFQVSAGVIFRF